MKQPRSFEKESGGDGGRKIALYFSQVHVSAHESHLVHLVLNTPEYPFNINYSVYEYSDIHNQNSPIFDFVTVPGSCLTLDDDLLHSLVDCLLPGGIIHIHNTNSNSRIYGEEYEMQPTYPIFSIIDDFPQLTSYHIPYGIGHNILIKH